MTRRARKSPSAPVTPQVVAAYRAWVRASSPLLVTPIVALALQQALIAAAPSPAVAPPPLRGMLIALSAGSVIFGQRWRRRPLLLPGGRTLPQAVREARSASYTLMGFAFAPAVLGVIVIAISRSIVDLYLLLAFTLVGFMLLYPRAPLWAEWLQHLTAPPGATLDAASEASAADETPER